MEKWQHFMFGYRAVSRKQKSSDDTETSSSSGDKSQAEQVGNKSTKDKILLSASFLKRKIDAKRKWLKKKSQSPTDPQTTGI